MESEFDRHHLCAHKMTNLSISEAAIIRPLMTNMILWSLEIKCFVLLAQANIETIIPFMKIRYIRSLNMLDCPWHYQLIFARLWIIVCRQISNIIDLVCNMIMALVEE